MNTASERVEFSLLEEPWIPCQYLDGSAREVSLKTVFQDAASIRSVTGELPTHTFVLVRLLLAIMHRAFKKRFEGDPVDEWEELWTQGLPVTEIHEYLESYRDRFDLLHPVTPFYQVAGLHTAKHEVKDISPLLFDVPSNNRLFTARAGRGLDSLSLGEAARSLVHLHAFDVAGIKSGMVGDDRVKGGKGYPIGTGFDGNLGGVLIDGESLEKTLLLNLVPNTSRDASADQPPWEREADTAAVRAVGVPQGPVDLMTWQSRRVRLVSEEGRVVGCVVGNGDKVTPHNRYNFEAHSAWRYSPNQSNKGDYKGVDVYFPKEHSPERAFWRGIAGLSVMEHAPLKAGGPSRFLPPKVVEWIAKLHDDGVLPRKFRVAPHAFGVDYGAQQSVVTDVLDDSFSLQLAVLHETHGARVSDAARAGVDVAEKAVASLATLAGNIALAAGGVDAVARSRAFEEGYFAIDRPFRLWVAGLDLEQDAEAQLDEWKQRVRSIMSELERDIVDLAGEVAWKGRLAPVGRGQNPILMTTSVAQRRFREDLNRILLALSTQNETEKSVAGASTHE